MSSTSVGMGAANGGDCGDELASNKECDGPMDTDIGLKKSSKNLNSMAEGLPG